MEITFCNNILIVFVSSFLFCYDLTDARNALGFGNHGSYGLGSPCEYDEDCVITHSYCRHQEVCDCKRGFIPSEDGAQCRTLVGSFCQTQYDCNSLEHSECRQEMCQCEQRFVPNKGGTKCLAKVASYRGQCELDSQCVTMMGDGSFCNQGGCECLPRHHFSSFETRCFLNKGLYQMCRNVSECYLGDDYSTSFVDCVNGQCNCRYGYRVTEDNKCAPSNSSAMFCSQVLLFLIAVINHLNNTHKF